MRPSRIVEAGYYVIAPAVRPCRCAGRTKRKRGQNKFAKKKTGHAPRFRKLVLTLFLLLRVENPQLERLADRLRAVHHVQLAQDLLHVVLHRERADLEDRADLEIRLAEINPLQDVLLAHREHALAGSLLDRGGGARELRAHPRRVQRRREKLREVSLARADAARPAGEGEQR